MEIKSEKDVDAVMLKLHKRLTIVECLAEDHPLLAEVKALGVLAKKGIYYENPDRFNTAQP